MRLEHLRLSVSLLAVAIWTSNFFASEWSPALNLMWYAQSADKWEQALPVGNGRLGAMVFGRPQQERLQLNENTVWSGGPTPNADRPEAYKALPELRTLIGDGKYAEAERFANKNFNGPTPYTASYQTLGDLTIDSRLPDGPVESYRRELNLTRAIASVSFKSGGVTFSRETFATAADQAVVHWLAADRPGQVSFTVRLTRAERARTIRQGDDTLVMRGYTGDTLKFEARCRVVTKGGTVHGNDDGTLTVTDADEAIVLLTAATNYLPDFDRGYIGGDLSFANRQIEAAAAKPYEKLRADHVADYGRYFDRVTLDLGGASDDRPTDERLRSYAKDRNPAFAALVYQFGRYLLISSSRPTSALPANLQGIWGDGLNLP